MNSSTPTSPDHHLPGSCHALVLLVDDQSIVAESIRRALENQKDIDFHYCGKPEEAIAVANRINPTVILLDLIMPKVDGLTVLRQFRANPVTRETPIVMLSAKEDPQIKSDAFAAGANDYLVKLPDAVELRARLRYHSKVCLLRIQRDEAFNALRESQRKMVENNTELSARTQALENALMQVRQLHGLLPLCCRCNKVRDDASYWHQIETYISQHSDVKFSHGLCPKCHAIAMDEMEKNKI